MKTEFFGFSNTEASARNDDFARAWNEWKEICWVHGCGDEAQSLLAPLISNRFADLLRNTGFYYLVGDKTSFAVADEQAAESTDDDDAKGDRPKYHREFVDFFDSAIKERELFSEDSAENIGRGHASKKKLWKDVIWREAAESSDPWLKVVFGRLTSLENGLIRDIVAKYITQETGAYAAKDEKDRKGVKHRLPDSLDAEINNAEGESGDGSVQTIAETTQDMTAPEPWCPSALSDDDKRYFTCLFAKLLTVNEMALWLAKVARISTDSEELYDFIGVHSSQCSERWKVIGDKIRKGISQDDRVLIEDMPELQLLMRKVFFEKIKAEKSSARFLKTVEDKLGTPKEWKA